MLFEVFNHLSVKCFHLLMIQRSLFNEIQGVALHAKADALEGNLFKICSGGSRIT